MTHPALAAVEERAEEIVALADSNERLGRLDDAAAKLLRDTGVIRMLQPAKYGGAEAHPRDFAETVMRIASLDGSAGWVARPTSSRASAPASRARALRPASRPCPRSRRSVPRRPRSRVRAR